MEANVGISMNCDVEEGVRKKKNTHAYTEN